MTHLLRDLSLSRSEVGTLASTIIPSEPAIADDLPSPFGELAVELTDSELRLTAYEIFVGACPTSSSRHLSFVSNSTLNSYSPSHHSPDPPRSPALQQSFTSTATTKFKKTVGLKSRGSGSKKNPGSSGSGSGFGQGMPNRLMTVGELMRNQMKVSEAMDSRVRRAMTRIFAEQVGRQIESIVIPLELLQQLKLSDFTDQEEFEEWQKRTLKVLEAGLLLHPHNSLEKLNPAALRLRQIIHGASDRPIESGRNSETMQALHSAVTSLAGNRSYDGLIDAFHWACGIPLSLQLYGMLLQSCFNINDESLIIEEFDELMEDIKQTWGILGINEEFHNLCFTWVLFHRFVATGQMKVSLLHAAETQLSEVAKDAKTTKDLEYSKILSSTLSSIMRWSEKRLLAYHEIFDRGNVEIMQSIVSLGVAAAKILAGDITNEYSRGRISEVDVARDTIEVYIRSSLRTAFAQVMAKVDSSRRKSKSQPNALPVLAILAKEVGNLALNEKQVFSPILKRWHPLAASVAVITLHACYANELTQFISSVSELTPDAVQVLKVADKLEKDLVQIAVEDSVDSDDGGKAIICQMEPYEAEAVIANLVKVWIKGRLAGLKECVDRNLQQELWSSQVNRDGYAPSAAEVLRMINETLDAFFQLPIPMHPRLLPELMDGLDRCLRYYVTEAKSGCGSRNTFVPTLPPLTRCTTGFKFQGFGKKNENFLNLQKRNPQVSTNVDCCFGIPQLCGRINTLRWIRSEFDIIEERIITLLRNSESAHQDDYSKGLAKKFELCPVACAEGIEQLCEAVAYRLVFHDLIHLLWDGLYIGDPSSSRINPFLAELELKMMIISDIVQEKVRTHIIADIMRASFDGFLLVLLAGGPSRAFSRQDSQIIEDDFKSIKDLFLSNGDGLPSELIDKCSTTVRSVLPLFRTDTESLIELFRRATLETQGSSARSSLPLPPTSGQWDPAEPNTLLRVLCYRNDKSASKFLKKTYNLPKKL